MRRLGIAQGIGVAALATAMIAATAAGQGTAGTGTVGPIGQLLPEVRTTGAPDWAQPGTRLTWYAAGASVANAGYQWQESEDGTWEDPVTGKKYKQIEAPTAGGEGIFQLDVVGVDGPDVAVQWVLYGLDRSGGRFFGGTAGGGRDAGADPDDLWIHPDLLATIPTTDLPDLKILRGPYTTNGSTYQALAILSPDPNAYSSQIYDLATGTLLSTTSRTQGNASPLHAQGQDPPEANSQITIGRWLGTRQRDAAALAFPPPAWATPGTTLTYTGSWTFVNPFDPSGQAVTYPMRLTVELAEGGPTWRAYRASSDVTIGGMLDHTQASGVAAGTGPWWMSPAALALVRAGDVLDEDPITGQRLTVTALDDAAGTVTIASELAGLPSVATYDRTDGTLLAVTRTEQGAGITTSLQLASIA
ncbi:MAG: hypothetical protein U0869_04155 [Chloroflexota bacterium]